SAGHSIHALGGGDIVDSILDDIKKMLGLSSDYTVFDKDIIIHINTAIMALQQMGVGVSYAYYVQNARDRWDDFLNGHEDLEAVKTYIYLRVRMAFDPPTSSAVIDAMSRTMSELEWRLNVRADI